MPQNERHDLIPDTPTSRLLKASSSDITAIPMTASSCAKKHVIAPDPTPGGPPPNCQPGTYVSVPEPTPGGPPPNCQPGTYIVAPDPADPNRRGMASLPEWAAALGDDLSETFR